jgi:hypothetical protein
MMRHKRVARRESGQVIIFIALTLLVILGMMSLSLDGSYGLVRERQDQNAADFASLSATQLLARQCPGPESAPISYQDVWDVIKHEMDKSSDGVAVWHAEFLTSSGADLGIAAGDNTGPPPGGASIAIPPSACGVTVNVNSNWSPFLAGIVGAKQLSTGAQAAATNTSIYGAGVAIDSLNPVYPHAVLAGGSGTFIVDGDIFLNAKRGAGMTDVIDAKSDSNIYIYGTVKTVDPANTTGSAPVDWCFDHAGEAVFPLGVTSGPTPAYGGAVPPAAGPPAGAVPLVGPAVAPWTKPNQTTCNQGAAVDTVYPVVFSYNGMQGSQSTGTGDPLESVLPSPFSSETDPSSLLAPCPFQALNKWGSITAATYVNPLDSNAIVFRPGQYTFPVDISPSNPALINPSTGAPYAKYEFGDCSPGYGYEDPATPTGLACSRDDPFPTATDPTPSSCVNHPGTFLFDGGLSIRPAAGQSVLGNNIMIAVKNPLPNSILNGNVSATGTGNGDPCLPANTYGIPEFWNGTAGNYKPDWLGTSPCAGPGSLYAAQPVGNPGGFPGWQPGPTDIGIHPPAPGPGTNDSLMINGALGSIVKFTPPQSDAQGYADIMFYQDRSTMGNWGFNAAPQVQGGPQINGADITVSGVLYNASLPTSIVGKAGGIGFNTWDNGVPFYPGGTLQTGYGAGPATGVSGFNMGWFPSRGTVTINGVAVVSDFNTDGDTPIIVRGKLFPYETPNGTTPPGLVG